MKPLCHVFCWLDLPFSKDAAPKEKFEPCTTVAAPHLRLSQIKIKIKLSKHHPLKTYWGRGGTASRILNLGTRWRWVVSFSPLAPTVQEAGWIPEPVWKRWRGQEIPLQKLQHQEAARHRMPTERRTSDGHLEDIRSKRSTLQQIQKRKSNQINKFTEDR